MQAQVQLSAQPDPTAHYPPSIGTNRTDAHSGKMEMSSSMLLNPLLLGTNGTKLCAGSWRGKAGGGRLDKRAGETAGERGQEIVGVW